VRPVGGGYGLTEHLRVTIGTPQENDRFLAALAASLRD
jgi:histidinol-phosphate/aromatic aminotransferase/cobyric acid decarboxylase-like protein